MSLLSFFPVCYAAAILADTAPSHVKRCAMGFVAKHKRILIICGLVFWDVLYMYNTDHIMTDHESIFSICHKNKKYRINLDIFCMSSRHVLKCPTMPP